MRNKRELTRGSREEDEKATYQTVGTMTPNRRLIAQYSDVYRPIIDTYFCRMHVHPVIRVHSYIRVCTRGVNNRTLRPI